ncbi:spore germination protein YndE [Caldalkalibacillus thermarum]|uniref:GerAB/ArcD/ProY family transporter n=1 Tax=Caldalkalibacillus thermarum TaxID=296745 RepID=UPI0016692EFE|nr:GerAB/ArcD/ProY family transporter [Caldalkalibacillus thermarum]GGK34622.1 spore germination protein YndE [Caldalkalibacillus thermarum]
MNNQFNYKISPLEMSISIMTMLICVSVFVMPSRLAETMNSPDGWISIMISGLAVAGLVTLYTRLQRHFPGQTLMDYFRQGTLGKWWALLMGMAFVLYFVGVAAYLVRTLVFVVRLYVLDQTPSEAIASLFLLTTTYAVSKGLQGIIHLNLLFLPVTLFMGLGILSFNLPAMELANLLPVLGEGLSPVLKGVKEMIVPFLGVEILFFFMAHMTANHLRATPLNVGILVVTLIYVMLTVMSYAVFSLEAVKVIAFPTVELAKEVEVPGGFFERLESLMITIWIMTIFNAAAVYQYLTVTIINDQFLPHTKLAWLPSLTAFVIFIIAFVPKSITELFTFAEWVGWLGAALFFLGVGSGYVSVWVRNKTATWNMTEGSDK